MSTPVRTDYELALQAWVAAAITAGGGSYKAHFAPRSAGRDAADSYVCLQAVRRETRGTPFQAATTESYEGASELVGRRWVTMATLSPRLLAIVEALPLRADMRVLQIGGAPGAAARAVARVEIGAEQ